MINALTLRPLTAKSFKQFGDVIETGANPLPINYGLTERHHDLAQIDIGNEGRTLINIFRSKPMALPIFIKIMERHPLGSQAFMPLTGNPYIVVVAPKGGFDESKIQGFLASAKQGVNYHAGVWHHYSLALNNVSDFLVIDRGGSGDNCDEIGLSTPLTINDLDTF